MLRFSDWRDPVQPSGFGESASGLPAVLPGEGYPKFFDAIGVRPTAKGGVFLSDASGAQFDEARTREIRATDIVLRIPRIGTRLDYRASDNNFADTQTQFIETLYTTHYYNQVKGKSILRVLQKFVPPTADNGIAAIYGQLLDTGSPEFDDVLMSTLYMVSPPGVAGPESVPDGTWEPYPQYFVFWNLNSATNVIPGSKPDFRLKLFVPLAGGLAQPAIDAILLAVNDIAEEAAAFLFASKAQGYQWTP